MFFNFFNIPASFQYYIKKILVEKLDIFTIIYLTKILMNIKNTGRSQVKIVL